MESSVILVTSASDRANPGDGPLRGFTYQFPEQPGLFKEPQGFQPYVKRNGSRLDKTPLPLLHSSSIPTERAKPGVPKCLQILKSSIQ